MNEADICMVYDERGNAFDCFDYTPEALRNAALRLERALGHVTTVTMLPNPWAEIFPMTAA